MNVLFRSFAFLAGTAAVYHAVGLFHHVNEAPLWRHALFIAIDVGCALRFLFRPRWFIYAFAALALQQCIGHGTSFLQHLGERDHFPWIDLGVLVFMPVALIALVIGMRRR